MRRASRAPRIWRDLCDELRALGAKSVRTNGSHQTWRFDDGGTFVVVCNHLNDQVPIGIRAKFRRLRERRGACAGEEPALLGEAGLQWSRLEPSSSERTVDHGQRKQWRRQRWQRRFEGHERGPQGRWLWRDRRQCAERRPG